MHRLLLALCVLGPSLLQAQTTLSSADRDLYARLVAMADARRLDTAVVDAAISSASEPVAAFAALSVGQVGAEAAAPRIARLRALLTDPRPAVAASAAYALGIVRDSVSVSVLAAAVTSGDERRALEAAWSLGQIGEPARAQLVELLSGPAAAGVRVQLLLAAVKLRPVPLESVLPHLRDANGSVAWAAAYAIARPRAPEGVQALIEAVSFPTARDGVTAPATGAYYDLASAVPHRIRAEIARVLTRQAVGGDLADTAFAIVSGLAADPHPHVRINALRSIATYGDRARSIVVGAARDPDANVRLAAVQAIATAEGSSPDWIALWISDTSFTFRRYVLEAQLARGGWSSWVAEWAGNSDPAYRLSVAAALGGSRLLSTARPLLVRLANDGDARVRAAALTAIAADSARITSGVRELLRFRLADRDAYVRAAATAGLARSPRADDLAAVVDALSRSLIDRDSGARTAALRYLAAAWRRDSTAFTPETFTILGRMQAPGDASSRGLALALPPLAHWGATQPSAREARWYRAIVDDVAAPALAGRPAVASVVTSRGTIRVEFFGGEAPLTVHNFLTLARRGYYDGLVWHRVVPNFVAQDGDPRGDGMGGPGYSIRDELNPRRYERGVLGMALSGPDTGGSQYFLTHSPQPHLDGGYTVFGRVTAGLAVLDALVQGDRIIRIDVH